MNILVFAHTNDEDSLETGVTSYNLELTKKLSEINFVNKIIIILSPRNQKRYEIFSNTKKIKILSVENQRRKPIFRFLLLFLLSSTSFISHKVILKIFHPRYCKVLEELEKNEGPFHIAFYTVFGLIPESPAMMKSLTGARVVSSLHDSRMLHQKTFNLRKKITNFFEKRSLKIVCEFSDVLLSPSSEVKNDIRKFSKDALVFNSFAVPDLKNIYGWKPRNYNGRKYIYYPNTFIETKNHFIFLDILDKDPELNLVLSGTGKKNNLAKVFFDECRSRNLNKRIFHEGFVSKERKIELIEGSLVLIIPSIGYESFSLSIWEAFALGCPVIASNDSDLPEQVKEFGWYCDPKNPEEILSLINIIKLTNYENSLKQTAARDYYLKSKKNSLISSNFKSWIYSKKV